MNIRKLLRLTHRELTASPMVPAIVVFLTLLLLIFSSWRTAQLDIDKTRNSLIEEHAVLSETNVKQQVFSYENALMATRGLILSSDEVNREEWKTYINALNIPERRPGMLGIGLSEFIEPSDLAAYESRVRSEGFNEFRVWPNNEPRDIYSSITYIEPFDDINRPALGFDMYSDENRREAMNRAIETGQPAMTKKILLVQGGENRITGLNLYQALYKKNAPIDTPEQRRQAVEGFIYAPFIARQLFDAVFNEDETNYNVRVYDGSETDPEHLLYEQNESDKNYQWVRKDTIDISGTKWTFEFGIKDEVIPESIRTRPNTLLVGGVIFSLLVSGVVYLLLQIRTRRLAEKENIRVQKAKDNMLSLASHQLRTPATGVKQYVGMVLEGFTGELTEEQEYMLKNAYDSNERQLRIINEFLYVAKAEADRIVVSPQRIDLVEITKRIIEEMQGDIKDAGHKLKLMHKKPSIYCAADPHSIRMIIENLISNAIKYTPSGGNISVEIAHKSKETIVVVKDNGVGIKQSDLPKLFQQFSRIPNPLTRQISGSGIGLYLAKQLAERNNGYITVESEQGKGSVFTLHLTSRSVKNFTEQAKNRR